MQQVHYRDTLFELSAKTLILQTYFELNEYEALYSFLDSFNVFLQRKKATNHLHKHHQNLIKYLKKLLNLPKYDKAAYRDLQDEVNQITNITEKGWLLSKIVEGMI